MKYAIISDIHSNIHALKAALKEIEPQVDQIVCIGDVVGYNAKPKECIDLMKNHSKVCRVVQGNHDLDSANFETLTTGRSMCLSQDAYTGIKYSSSLLSEEEKEWLRGLPKEFLIEDKKMPFWISHYSPDMCTDWGYILSDWEASRALTVFKGWGGGSNIFFFGHSHVPTFVEETKDSKMTYEIGARLDGKVYSLKPDCYYLINPGAIGQPRDKGYTSYVIFDTEKRTVTIRGLQYNILAARKAIEDAGYSERIARRLGSGNEITKKQVKKARCKAKQKQIDAQKKK